MSKRLGLLIALKGSGGNNTTQHYPAPQIQVQPYTQAVTHPRRNNGIQKHVVLLIATVQVVYVYRARPNQKE